MPWCLMGSSFCGLFTFIALSIYPVSILSAQIMYSHHFTKKMRLIGGDFVKPVEGYYKVKLKRADGLMRYDLVLDSQEREFEMRFWINIKNDILLPHVTAFTLANSLASNDPHFDMAFNIWPETEAFQLFNASWAAFIDFIPKRSFSEKHFGRLVCIYHPEKGMMNTVLLFNRHDEEKDRRLYTLQFQPKEISLPGK